MKKRVQIRGKRANRFFITYTAARRHFTGKEIPTQFIKTSWGKEIFEKIAEQIELREAETKQKVDRSIYVMSHFSLYGENTYPTHFLGENTWKIYEEFKSKLKLSKRVDDEEPTLAKEKELLNWLAETREEDPEVTIRLLAKSGLFSDEFVMSRITADRRESRV